MSIGPTSAPKDVRAEKLQKAAAEFEAIFVKQLLKEAKIGGEQKSGGYGDMAVDALADGVERGGGLGLARQIEKSLAAAHGPGPTQSPAAAPSPNSSKSEVSAPPTPRPVR